MSAPAVPGKLKRVSDHAVLRYCERVLAISRDEIEKHIRASVEPYLGTLGNANYPLQGTGCVAVVRDNVVLTVQPQK